MEFFTFMWRPMLACLLLPGLLVYLGLHVVRRGIIFVDLALAQVAALGSCVGILLGHDPSSWRNYGFSLGFTLVGAAIFTFTRTRNERVPQEALIGIVYVVAAAASIILLNKTNAEANEAIKRTLIGDVLLVGEQQILRTFVLYIALGVVHFIFRRRFLALSFAAGDNSAPLSTRWWDFLFYALFGWAVTSFVQIGGVLLVFSYLIVPAVCANFLAHRLGVMLLVGWITATVASGAGLYASYRMDLPTGAAIVCALGAALVVVAIFARLRKTPSAK